MTYHDWLPWVGIVVVAGSLAAMLVLARNAPLYDENERPVDEVQDDPRPAQVLRDYWADRETRGGLS